MLKHAETFHANKDYKLAIVVFGITSLFSKQKFAVHLSNVICTKTRAPLFLYENELLQHCLSYKMRQMAKFLVLEVRFF